MNADESRATVCCRLDARILLAGPFDLGITDAAIERVMDEPL